MAARGWASTAYLAVCGAENCEKETELLLCRLSSNYHAHDDDENKRDPTVKRHSNFDASSPVKGIGPYSNPSVREQSMHKSALTLLQDSC